MYSQLELKNVASEGFFPGLKNEFEVPVSQQMWQEGGLLVSPDAQ